MTMSRNASLRRFLPIVDWAVAYNRGALADDLVAAIIVTIMLIPQSLAYALLAGLPAEMGLYASIVPILLYALFGTSRVLAVGPVAVVSLMTAAAIGQIAEPGSDQYVTAALTLAFLSGGLLMLMGFLRLGFLANFLSHPVIAGFISATGLLIAASQVKHLLGIEAGGHSLVGSLTSIAQNIHDTNGYTVLIGAGALVFLLWARRGLRSFLRRAGVRPRAAEIAAKAGPVVAVVASTLLVWGFDLAQQGVATVGAVPQSLPPLTLPSFSPSLWRELGAAALLISVVGFVESVSVAQTLAARRRQRIDPDQELIGLGAANLGASFSGGYPVTGGFSRSVVNFDAGARTQAAGAFTAMGLALAALFLTPFIFFLPKAVLGATIIVAVLSLIDIHILQRSWAYSKADFAAVCTTVIVTLGFGVELGVSLGVLLSILIHLYRTSRPHIAVVGRVPGTEHYRNVLRHEVITDDRVLALRVDESLYFANARYLEDRINDLVAQRPDLEHFVLICNAVNTIDMSALESLHMINRRLDTLGVLFHLSEVKGPVIDRLNRSDFLQELTGRVFLSQHEAMQALSSHDGVAVKA